MQSLRVNGYDMAYLDIGKGPPLVCVHGSLCDFRNWSPVLGPLTTRHRVISVSLRHFFPDHWNGSGHTYSLAQHIEDVIAFIADRLPYYAVPRFLEFVDELPRTIALRVDKQVLRERGVSPETWDREAAGIRLRRERL